MSSGAKRMAGERAGAWLLAVLAWAALGCGAAGAAERSRSDSDTTGGEGAAASSSGDELDTDDDGPAAPAGPCHAILEGGTELGGGIVRIDLDGAGPAEAIDVSCTEGGATDPDGHEVAALAVGLHSVAMDLDLAVLVKNPTAPLDFVFTIHEGAAVGASTTAKAALTTGSLPSGSVLKIVNLGRIQGRGGDGGFAGVCYQSQSLPGQAGGAALELTLDVEIDNTLGEIWGGGGGGGGGGDTCDEEGCGGTGGGHGGAGLLPGAGGTFEPAPSPCNGDGGTNYPGTAGTDEHGGSGSGGGKGGEPGQPGATGYTHSQYSTPGAPGGAAGAAIVTTGHQVSPPATEVPNVAGPIT